MIPSHIVHAYAPPSVTTTDATPTPIYNVEVPLNSLIEIAVEVRARRTSTFGASMFRRIYRVQNNAGTLTVLQEIAPVPDQNANGYDVTIAVDDPTATATVSVTGASGHAVAWTLPGFSATR